MAEYKIEFTVEAKDDLDYFTAFERKIILTDVKTPLKHQPVVETRNRKISPADDFEQEVAALRKSQTFQRFLDERLKSKKRILIEEIEKEVEAELKR
jgi:hypothetical protein